MTLLAKLAELEARGTPVAICTITRATGVTPRHTGAKMLVTRMGRFEGSIGGGEVEQLAIEKGKAAIQNYRHSHFSYQYGGKGEDDKSMVAGEIEVFIDPIFPKHTIIVIGAGHVGQQVVALAKWLGYHVILSDDRPELCTKESCPGADLYIPCLIEDLPQQIDIGPRASIVLTTRNADVDIKGLPSLLGTRADYIGVIGSEKRKDALFSGLRAAGVSEEQIAQIHSPIGLELNAETPQEIALSILSEILLVSAENDRVKD